MKLRKCTKCGEEKEESIEFFYLRKKNKKFYSVCKSCKDAANKKWISENKERFKKLQADNYQANKRQIQDKRNEHLDAHPEARIARNLRRRINFLIKGEQKSISTMAAVNCTDDELRAHLETTFHPPDTAHKYLGNMTWEKYGPKGWHVDHKIPCKEFDLNDPEQLKACFHYTNLQALWWYENLSKGASTKWKKSTSKVYAHSGKIDDLCADKVIYDAVINTVPVSFFIPKSKTAIIVCDVNKHGSVGLGSNMLASKAVVGMKNKLNAVGVRSIIIYDHEWINFQDRVRGYVRAILNRTSCIRIDARKCILKPITSEIANKFLDENHIQGSASGTHIGLFFNEMLVASVTYTGYPNQKNTFNLSRYCVKIGYSIRGGLGKLQKEFIRKYKPTKIISFSDNRWSEGNLYTSLGFVLSDEIRPDYQYFKVGTNGPLEHKFNHRKSKIKDIQPNETESSAMHRLGWSRIYDCGKIRWEIKIA